MSDLAVDQYGRKVLLYLLAPRDPIHFHPDIVKVLQDGDDNPTRFVVNGLSSLTTNNTFHICSCLTDVLSKVTLSLETFL